MLVENNVLRFLGSLFSMSIKRSDIGSVLGRLPFSGWLIDIRRRVKSTSIHSICAASPILALVSFRSCRSVAIVLLDAAISVSISASVGMNGTFLSLW